MLSRSSDHGHAPAPDPLSEVLQDLRLSGVAYGRCELKRPWGIEFPPQDAARFHFVAEGECWLRAPGLGWIPMRAGDVALVPLGKGHSLADTARGKRKPLAEYPLEEIGDRTYALRGAAGAPRTCLHAGAAP